MHSPNQSPGAKPYFGLNAGRLAKALLLLALVCGVLQVMLGASLAVVLLCLIAIAAGLLTFAALGAYNAAAWMALFYALGNGLVAVYIKTALGQPLDSYLQDPLNSYLMLAISSTSLLIAMLLAKEVKVGKPIFRSLAHSSTLGRFAWGCFILGIASFVINRWLNEGDDTGFGGLALFRDLLFMAVIAGTAKVLEETQNRRSWNPTTLVFVVGGVFVGLIDNQKTQAALPVVAYFATTVFYRRGVNRGPILVLAICGVAFSALLAPTVHALRAMGQQSLSLNERIEFVADTTLQLLERPEQLMVIEQLAQGQFTNFYYNYLGDSGTSQMLLGRYVNIQQIDPVVAQVNRRGPMGGDAVWPGLVRLLPGFLYGEKSEYREEFLTVLHYGLISPDAGRFPTLPIAGQAYAAYGVWGVLLIPFASFLLLGLVVKKFGWSTNRNIFGIFFFIHFVVVYANQGSFGQYVGTALRSLPIFMLLFLAMLHVAHIGVARRRRLPSQPDALMLGRVSRGRVT
jgi:hypothetical protein